MALSANEPREYAADTSPSLEQLPCQASTTSYYGSALSADSNGDVGPLLGSETFAGFAEQKADNSSGAAAAIKVKIRRRGRVKLTVATVDDDNDLNATVYATDDDTFTLSSASAATVGKVERWVTSTTCWVYFEALALRSI